MNKIQLGKVCSIVMGQSPPGSSYNEVGDGVVLINGPTEFTDKYPIERQWTNKPTKICKKGDVLICVRGSSTGRMNIANDNYCIGRGVAAISGKSEAALTEYIYYLLDFEVNNILLKSSGSTFPNVTSKELKELSILLFDNDDQKNIVNILTTWDKSIELKQKLLQEKQKQKKGLMERLLTGKLRLKGFNEEWKEVKLSKMFDRVTRKNSIGNSNVLTISAQQGLINQKNYFNKIVASDTLDNYYLLNNGEFAYNKSYSNGYPMGAIKRLNNYESGGVTTLYICFKLKDEFQECSDFLEQYFEFGLMNKGLTQIAYEGGRAHGLLNVSSSDFFSLKIYIPSIEEQVEIAKILRTTNNEVSLLKQEIEALKQQKKGLMQLLLTGIVRVNCD